MTGERQPLPWQCRRGSYPPPTRQRGEEAATVPDPIPCLLPNPGTVAAATDRRAATIDAVTAEEEPSAATAATTEAAARAATAVVRTMHPKCHSRPTTQQTPPWRPHRSTTTATITTTRRTDIKYRHLRPLLLHRRPLLPRLPTANTAMDTDHTADIRTPRRHIRSSQDPIGTAAEAEVAAAAVATIGTTVSSRRRPDGIGSPRAGGKETEQRPTATTPVAVGPA